MAKETDRHIYKRGRYYHVRVKADGWWQTRSTGKDNIKDARIEYAKFLTRATAEKPLDNKPEKPFDPLLDILRGHIAHIQRKKGQKAADRYRNALVHIERHLKNPRVNTLAKERFDDYITDRLNEAAAPTVQKEITFLRAAFSWAGKRVPHGLLKGCKVPGGNKARNRLLTKAEIARFREELAKSTILDHFLVALYTGLRKGELRGMQMQDIDFQAGTISIPNTKTGNPKTVTMHKTVKEILFQRRSDDPTHKPFHSPVNLNRPYNRAARRARIYNVVWHDLRRAMASYMFMTGSDLKTVMTQGGWKTSAVLLKVYAQVTSEHVKQQVARLDFEGESGTGPSLDHNPALEPRGVEKADL